MADADDLYHRGAAALGSGDHAAARLLMRHAGEAGRLDAAVIHVNFVASGLGGRRDWPGALGMLRGLARENRRSAIELALIEQMALTADGDPLALPAAEPICEAPHIFAFRSLFTPAECRY